MNENDSENNRARYDRWVKYYVDKLNLFNGNYLFLIDDGSPQINLRGTIDVMDAGNLPGELNSKINLVSFKNNLGRSTQKNYRGWWRSFFYSIEIAKQYNFDKIIHIESDFYIVSQRMIEYIKNVSSGWTAFYSQFFRFPESAIQIICKDAYAGFKNFYDEAVMKDFVIGKSAEWHLPFDRIEKQFTGDRLGQLDAFEGWLKLVKTPCSLDYLGQVLPQFKPEDFEPFFEFEYKWE